MGGLRIRPDGELDRAFNLFVVSTALVDMVENSRTRWWKKVNPDRRAYQTNDGGRKTGNGKGRPLRRDGVLKPCNEVLERTCTVVFVTIAPGGECCTSKVWMEGFTSLHLYSTTL